MKSHENHPIYTTSFSSVYDCYIAKAQKKGHSKTEVDQIICRLTGYDQKELDTHLEKETDFQNFFDQAPEMHPNRVLISGSICGVKIDEIRHPLMKNIRYLDKLIDELARGRKMEKILREGNKSL